MTIPYTIIGFCCEKAIHRAEEMAGGEKRRAESPVRLSILPCSSKVDMLGLMKAFESGAEGVFILGCTDEDCSLVDGCRRAEKLVNYTKRLLDEIGIGGERLEMFHLGTSGCESVEQAVGTILRRIGAPEIKDA